ncbi:histone deacetylase [Conexibacter sp. SYSU D00693]|uniref:histone deacetylase family protein n=1 Tax=Conexibacter sp. SYSU D00693 TaxID=2812560 RepID=UPI001F11F795|nr:histone deacetylase [Conexibacter sp. SYSU D00693]
MAPPVLFSHPSSLEHDPGPHPERPERITAVMDALEARGWLGFERRESPACDLELIERVHPRRHVLGIQELCAIGGGAIDMDTVVSEGSWHAAVHGSGGAVAMVDALLGEGAPAGAAIHRPPGHHAEPARAMGFCLFNHVAVAAQRALDAHGVSRVLVLDWDVHHGNGTDAIFRARDDVLFVSIHQSPLYPGTGGAGERGVGDGAGYTLNVPVPGGSGDETFCSVVEHAVVPLARAYAPELVLVSAGFDAHADDPLAGCRVTDGGFAAMAGSVTRLAVELDVPVGFVLEGGYELGALARGCCEALAVLGGAAAAPAVDGLAVHPLAEEALARLREGGPLAV